MRFKTDQNLPIECAEALRRAGHDAMSVQEQGLAGSPDDHVLAVCKAEDRALVTADLDFADTLRYPPSACPGLIVFRTPRQGMFHLLALTAQVAALAATQTVRGRLWIVEPGKMRIRG